MDLLLCEKPSQARAYSEALGIKGRDNGFYKGGGYLLTWCFGHLMGLAEPNHYDIKYKKWKMADLPIIPSQFHLTVASDKKKQYMVIKELLKKCKRCFICTDFDREGEAIAREVLESLKFKGEILRIKCSSYEASDIKKAIQNPLTAQQTEPMYNAQMGRSRADWLYGMNLSRAISLAYPINTRNLSCKLSIGRVLTPMLNICALREKQIRDFSPTEYYQAVFHFNSASGSFKANFDLPEEFQNEFGGFSNKEEVETVISGLIGSEGKVTDFSNQDKKEFAPLPYKPSELTLDAEKSGLHSSKRVKVALQKLYESGLVTYPRN